MGATVTTLTTSRTALGGLLAGPAAGALAERRNGAALHRRGDNLIAEQDIEASDVNVCNDETTLTVTYEATYPWCLLETHLHVATIPMLPPQDPDIAPIDTNIPQTNKGNPIQASSTTATNTAARAWPPSRSPWTTSARTGCSQAAPWSSPPTPR